MSPWEVFTGISRIPLGFSGIAAVIFSIYSVLVSSARKLSKRD